MSRAGRRRLPWVAVLAVAVAVACAAGLWWFWPASPEPWADPDDDRLVALGKVVYEERCAVCHGTRLEGEPDWQTRKPDGLLPAPPHDATGHSWHHPDAQLFAITKYGIGRFAPPGYRSAMPAFEEVLTDAEIWAALAYIKSHWPARERAFQAQMNPPDAGQGNRKKPATVK